MSNRVVDLVKGYLPAEAGANAECVRCFRSGWNPFGFFEAERDGDFFPTQFGDVREHRVGGRSANGSRTARSDTGGVPGAGRGFFRSVHVYARGDSGCSAARRSPGRRGGGAAERCGNGRGRGAGAGAGRCGGTVDAPVGSAAGIRTAGVGVAALAAAFVAASCRVGVPGLRGPGGAVAHARCFTHGCRLARPRCRHVGGARQADVRPDDGGFYL